MKAVSIVVVALVCLSGCSSSDGQSAANNGPSPASNSCEVNGKSGTCNAMADPAACLSSTVLCRCVIKVDNSPSDYESLDCVQFCRSQAGGYTGGGCFSDSSVLGGKFCGCTK